MEAINKLPEDLSKDLQEIFAGHDDALAYINGYNHMLQLVDDLVDEKINDPEKILEAISYVKIVFTLPFFLKYHKELTLVALIIANTWADSVKWENSTEHWKTVHGDVLRHGYYGMIFAVILLIGGWEACRKISPRLREWIHLQHLNDKINYGDKKTTSS